MDSNSITKTEVATAVVKFGMLFSLSYVTLKCIMDLLDPTKQERKASQKRAQAIFDKLKLNNIKTTLNQYELVVASQLIDPNSIPISWVNIGGLDSVIDDIKSDIILPMKLPEILVNKSTHKPPTGVLLHGPPGCGKTMLAKATAREAGFRFINLEVAMLTDKWYGESQKLAKAVFTLAVKIQPCIIFIDEIDSFLRSRDLNDHEATAMVKAQFMTLWDGLETDPECQVIIMGATNRPRDVDHAILRRMPAMYSIGLPDRTKRGLILKAMVDESCLGPTVDIDLVAELTEEFSGSDLRELYRAAAMIRVKEFVKSHSELLNSIQFSDSTPSSTSSSSENYSLLNESDGSNTLRHITMDDFLKVIERMKSSKRDIGHAFIGIEGLDR